MTVPGTDAIFSDPRLAVLYDTFDGERSDLDAYAALVDEWGAVPARRRLRPGGHLVFETRRPERRAWRGWTPELSTSRAVVPGVGAVRTWVEVTAVQEPLVSFRWTFVLERDGQVLTSDSTLRFRSREEVAGSLIEAGFVVEDVRDAPDRPGDERVFVAGRCG